MAKLNQVIAVESGVKSKSHSSLSELHKINQKGELFNGFSKTYQPNEDGDETLPPESKRVQYTVVEQLRALNRTVSDLVQITARKDYTNTVAKADVKVDGQVVVKSAPVSFLLFR